MRYEGIDAYANLLATPIQSFFTLLWTDVSTLSVCGLFSGSQVLP